MPEPMKLPRVANAVVEQNMSWDRSDVEDAVRIAFAAAKGDMDTVITLAQDLARRNMDAVESQQYLVADKPGKAEMTVMNANARNKAKAS